MQTIGYVLGPHLIMQVLRLNRNYICKAIMSSLCPSFQRL